MSQQVNSMMNESFMKIYMILEQTKATMNKPPATALRYLTFISPCNARMTGKLEILNVYI